MSKWEMARLGDVCDVNMGQSPSSESYNQEKKGLPFYQGNTDFGEINPVVRYYCDEPSKIANEDDVLLSVRAPIGALNIAQEKCCIGRGLTAITQKQNITNFKYIFYVLKNKHAELNSKGTGSTFKAINKQNLLNTTFPLPPLETQKHIAKTLDTASEVIALHKKQLAELDNLIKSIFYDMFGDPVVNDMGWGVMKLGDCLKVIGGYAFKSKEFQDAGIPVIKIGNINSGVFTDDNISFWKYDSKLDRYLLSPNDIVISLTGTVGKDDYANVCILPEKYERYYLNQRNAKLEILEILNTNYLHYLMKDAGVKGQLTGISRGIRQANISNSDITSLQIPLPPLLLQQKFADIVTKIEEQKDIVKKAIDESQYLFDSLMSEYFE